MSRTTLGGCCVLVLETPRGFSFGGEMVRDAEVGHSSTNRMGKGSVREGQTNC